MQLNYRRNSCRGRKAVPLPKPAEHDKRKINKLVFVRQSLKVPQLLSVRVLASADWNGSSLAIITATKVL